MESLKSEKTPKNIEYSLGPNIIMSTKPLQ